MLYMQASDNMHKGENLTIEHQRSRSSSTLTFVLLNKLRCHAHFKFSANQILDPDCCYKFTYFMANSADPDQLASSEANWSGSTMFAKAGYIRVQQDKG